MTQKVCVVTGANSGLGKATALNLSKLGHKVIMICRNEQKGKIALEEIRNKTKNKSLLLLVGDLSSTNSIYKLYDEISNSVNRLDVLINNAGVYLQKRSETKDGFETTFGVNYLGHFLLTYLCLNLLKESAPSRVINVTSRIGQEKGVIDFDDINSKKGYSGSKAYYQSKLAIVLSTYSFAKNYGNLGITFNTYCPGVVRTNIIRDNKFARIFWKLFGPFFQSPSKGSETAVFLATNPELYNTNGCFFTYKKERLSSPTSYDEDLQESLWKFSFNVLNLND